MLSWIPVNNRDTDFPDFVQQGALPTDVGRGYQIFDSVTDQPYRPWRCSQRMADRGPFFVP